MLTIEGIVLKERSVGEQDKFIDILTKESGVLELSVKGAKKINGKSASSTQLFAYSRFCVQQRKDRFYLNSAEPIHIFYNLRSSLSGLSLAAYFAEILKFCCTEEHSGNGDVMRLFLNTLHYLEKNLRSEKLLKSIFELRLMSEIGYMPDILACRRCGCYEPEKLFFFLNDGDFCCLDCFADSESSVGKTDYFKIKLPVLNAVRHIVLADFDRLFNFRVSEAVQSELSAISEAYLTRHLERSFNTLNFYKSIDSK
ncbi:MAG: DNA repair protein RecO [Ruminococcus sp.]|nr:DNA repair protein RecO [Ruminococcus sp.]